MPCATHAAGSFPAASPHLGEERAVEVGVRALHGDAGRRVAARQHAVPHVERLRGLLRAGQRHGARQAAAVRGRHCRGRLPRHDCARARGHAETRQSQHHQAQQRRGARGRGTRVCVAFASVWTPRRGRSPATGRIRCPAAQRQASQTSCTGAEPPACVFVSTFFPFSLRFAATWLRSAPDPPQEAGLRRHSQRVDSQGGRTTRPMTTLPSPAGGGAASAHMSTRFCIQHVPSEPTHVQCTQPSTPAHAQLHSSAVVVTWPCAATGRSTRSRAAAGPEQCDAGGPPRWLCPSQLLRSPSCGSWAGLGADNLQCPLGSARPRRRPSRASQMKRTQTGRAAAPLTCPNRCKIHAHSPAASRG